MKLNHKDQIFHIECKDIILREYLTTDLDAFHALTWQPEIYNFLSGWNVEKQTRTDWFLNYEIPDNKQFFTTVKKGEDIDNLRLRLGIILKETGEFIGWCCSGIKEELQPPNREIMYAISKNHRGKGYTSQAAEAITSYIFNNTNVTVLNAIALITNIPSNKVIKKIGYHFQSIIDIEDEQYNHYKIERTQWVKQRSISQ